MAERRCELCQWWVRLPKTFNARLVTPLIGNWAERDGPVEDRKVTDHGQCRRHSPRVSFRTVIEQKRQFDMVTAEFPDTPFDAWCGEFESK